MQAVGENDQEPTWRRRQRIGSEGLEHAVMNVHGDKDDEGNVSGNLEKKCAETCGNRRYPIGRAGTLGGKSASGTVIAVLKHALHLPPFRLLCFR